MGPLWQAKFCHWQRGMATGAPEVQNFTIIGDISHFGGFVLIDVIFGVEGPRVGWLFQV